MTTISFAVTDFHQKTCKVLGIRDELMLTYENSPAPLVKDTVVQFHATVWPLIDHKNLGTVRFTFTLPDNHVVEGLLENFTVDCIQEYHDKKIAEGRMDLANLSVKNENLTPLNQQTENR